MRLHSFVPDLSPKKPQGSRFEPGHQQKVRVHAENRWRWAFYHRTEQRFAIQVGKGWIVTTNVKFWTQRPNRPMPDPEIPTGYPSRDWIRAARAACCAFQLPIDDKHRGHRRRWVKFSPRIA